MSKPATSRRKFDRQKQQKTLLAFAEKQAEKTFSALPENINQESFDRAWQAVNTSIEKRSRGSVELYESGFNKALSIAIHHIEANQWKVRACHHFVRIPREKALRDEHWTKHAFLIYDAYADWEKHLQTAGFAQQVDDTFADLLLSLIFHSGVCDTARLLGVVDTLSNNPRLSTLNGLPYLSYTVPDNRAKYTNQTSETGKRRHRGLCFIAPPTLALFNHFLKYRKRDWSCENNLNSLCTLMQRRCDIDLFRKLKSAIFVTENFVSLTQPEVNFSIGKLPSFSLPESQFVSLQLAPSLPQSLSAFSSHLRHCSGLNADKVYKKDLYQDISAILSKADNQPSANSKKNRDKTMEKLKGLITQGTNDSETLLIEWFISLLSQEYKISTLRRYQTAIASEWLAHTEAELLSSYTAMDFELLYGQLLESIDNLRERNYAAGRLKFLHEFAIKEYHFPRLATDFFSQMIGHARPHVRAGVVNEVLYEQLLLAIKKIKNTNAETIETITAVVMVAFRCGLRLGEIVKLQTADVLTDIGTTRLYIAPNQYGRNKTESGNRIVPLSIMLLPDEKSLLEKHINKRRQAGTKLLFSMPDNPNKVSSGSLISNLVIYYLRQISGDDSYVFHHLRHSCVSRLQLILHGETAETLPLFVPYEPSQAKDIKQDLYGKHDKVEYALGKFAGHYSPATTYESYFHFTEYSIGKKLSALQLSTQGKLSSRAVSLPTLIQRCPKTQYLTSPTVVYLPSTDESIEVTLQNRQPRRTSLTTVHHLLNLYHTGETVDALLMLYDIDKRSFEGWYENALDLRTRIKTRYGNPALFTPERTNEILPSLPQSISERHYIEKLLPRLRSGYQDNKDDFTFVINYTLKNSNSTNSGVMFYDVDDFTRYVSTLALLRVKSHLRAITHRTTSKEWQTALKGIKHQPKTDESGNYQRQRRGAVRLLLIHPDEQNILASQNKIHRKMKERNRYSSHLLTYLFHMMAIMMLRKPIECRCTTWVSFMLVVNGKNRYAYHQNRHPQINPRL